jgi:hypothetical protein
MNRLFRMAAPALLAVLLQGSRARADETAPTAPAALPRPAPTVVSTAPPSKESPRWPIFPFVGLGSTRLQGWNVQAGLGYEPGPRTGGCGVSGPLAVGHYGQGGHGAQAGYGWCMSAYGGLSARATWLHTWGRPRILETRQHYLGVEGRVMFMGFHGVVGVLRRVEPSGGAVPGPDWALNLGVGIGY